MGNTRSRPISTTTQPISDLTDESTMGAGTHKPLCLLQLLRRSWRLMLSPSSSKRQASSSEGVKDERDNSRCSLCKDCDHQQQELLFDSESDMAPNAEEDLLVAMQPRGPHSGKERLRPPTYNAEDYTQALRRWGRRALANQQPQHHQHDPGNHHSHHQHHNTLPSTCTSTSSSGYASTGNNGEMTLRQFTSVSELLNKLKADLKLAFPSFVQEFVSAPADGISLLLETLRGVQLSQSTPPSATGPRRPRARRAAMDELGCVECLAACADRCPDAGRLLAQAQPGLLALACCLTSSLNRSRVIALQLLTRVCQSLGGHNAVSEAVSTLRLRFGEGGRFRFLAGALLAPKAAPVLRLAGISFLNAFLASAPRAQTKLYIQAEACEAGLEPRALQEWLKYLDDDDPASESLRSEVRKWSRNCVDVDALQGRARRAEETCRALNKKVSVLQKQLQQLQLDKLNEYNSRQPKQQLSADLKKKQQQQLQQRPRKDTEKKVSSSAEDEGISFSERSSSPEDPTTATTATPNNQAQDNDQETTIDDVIEELRIIVKDAEEELHDWNQLQCRDSATAQNEFSRSGMVALNGKGPAPQPSKARQSLRISEESARLDRVMKNASANAVGCLKIVVPGPQLSRETTDDEDKESAIVPAIIHPQPPRRAPPAAVLLANSLYPSHQLDASPILLAADDLANNSDLMLLHDEDEYGSDSLLSASKFNKLPIHQMHRNRRRPSSSSQDQKVESLTDFEISETILDERIPSLREREDIIGNSNSLGSKLQYSKCSSNTVQRKTERRKYLRRCQSQDHIEDSSSLHRNEAKLRTGVHDQIRKFESMNSFDERRSLPNYEDNNRLRRSESFHQTYAKNYTDDNEIATIMYKDSDDVEARDHFQRHNRKHRSITKSLDRIDEGLDSMVDVVVMRERQDHHQRRRSSEIEQRAKGEDKYTSFFDKKRERRDSGDKLQQQQYHDNDSRLFAGRHHDVLGFGKARFNAGMYSGNAHQQQQQLPLQQFMAKNIHPRGQTNILNHHNRGKVTDVVSGLY